MAQNLEQVPHCVRRRLAWLGATALAVLGPGWRQLLAPAAAQASSGRLDVVVTYRERVLLSPEARLIVLVHEEGGPTRLGSLLAQQTFPMQDPIPITVSLRFDPTAIDLNRRYVMTAHIDEHGRRRFHTAAPVPVLTYGAPNVLTLILVAAP